MRLRAVFSTESIGYGEFLRRLLRLHRFRCSEPSVPEVAIQGTVAAKIAAHVWNSSQFLRKSLIFMPWPPSNSPHKVWAFLQRDASIRACLRAIAVQKRVNSCS